MWFLEIVKCCCTHERKDASRYKITPCTAETRGVGIRVVFILPWEVPCMVTDQSMETILKLQNALSTLCPDLSSLLVSRFTFCKEGKVSKIIQKASRQMARFYFSSKFHHKSGEKRKKDRGKDVFAVETAYKAAFYIKKVGVLQISLRGGIADTLL